MLMHNYLFCIRVQFIGMLSLSCIPLSGGGAVTLREDLFQAEDIVGFSNRMT